MRIRCSHCEESKHLAYLSLGHDGQPTEKAVLHAKICPGCQGYPEQLYLRFDHHIDTLTDDLTSLALDIRLAEDSCLRHPPNLLLTPGGKQPKTLRARTNASTMGMSVALPCGQGFSMSSVRLPSVGRPPHNTAAVPLRQCYGREVLLATLHDLLDELRGPARYSILAEVGPSEAVLTERTDGHLAAQHADRMQRVLNLAGMVLHISLDRASLPDGAIEVITLAARYPLDLEFDLTSDERGGHDDLIVELIREPTGAKVVTTVNSNIAAVLLMLNSLGARKGGIVSYDGLIEIGGALHIPDVMVRAGVCLHEVDTTNRTHARDYEAAIGPRSDLLIRVHTSNYSIQGLAASVLAAQLASIAHGHGLPLLEDLDDDTLVGLTHWGLPKEPMVQETLTNDTDIVIFSGDKLFGGPQAGPILSNQELIGRIKKSPLKRALYVGKLTLATLEAVLGLYRDPDRLAGHLTTLHLLSRPVAEIYAQAEYLTSVLDETFSEGWEVATADALDMIGSGAQPVVRLISATLCPHPQQPRRLRGRALRSLEEVLRRPPLPVIGWLDDDTLWLDLR